MGKYKDFRMASLLKRLALKSDQQKSLLMSEQRAVETWLCYFGESNTRKSFTDVFLL
jgi:hypothetical protein